MAENKKSFILYSDQISLFENLDDSEAGKLIKHIFRYVNDQSPDAPDKLTLIAFDPIKTQLKRDLIDWERTKLQRSNAGKKGMENRWHQDNTVITKDNTVITPITNITVNDNVNVNDNDNDNVIEYINKLDERKLKFSSTLKPFLEIYGKKLLNEFYAYWTEPTPSGNKFKKELERTWDVKRRLEVWSRNSSKFEKPTISAPSLKPFKKPDLSNF